MIRREDVWPLGVLAFLLLTTAAWWALALWPMPVETPGWLVRTREVCFNAGPSGLPDRAGWILLIGEPLGMLAVIMVVWGTEVRRSLARLVFHLAGRVVVVAVLGAVALGLGAAVTRVAVARVPPVELAGADLSPETYPRVDLAWPEAPGLVDQRGEVFTLASLKGRPALVTFAYAHCTTVCPVLVQAALEARAELRSEVGLAVVALTLDPWRDTPSRLPDMAVRWGLEEGDFVLSGAVDAVEAALDAWNVPRERDERTGELAHPSLSFLVESDGTVAFATAGSSVQLAALGRRLRHPSRRQGGVAPGARGGRQEESSGLAGRDGIG